MTAPRKTPSRLRIDAILGTARVLLFLFCCTGVLILVSMLPITRVGSMSMLVLGVASSVGAFIVTCVFARWESISLSSIGVALDRGSATRLALGLLAGFVVLGIQWSLMWVPGHVHWEEAEPVSLGVVATTIAAFLFLSAREEIAFHGFALRRLDTLHGLWPALIGVSILFSLEHVAGGNSLLNAFAGAGMGSMLFGMAALATRGLAVPVGIHAAWNIGDWLRGGKSMPGIWRPVIEPGYESETQAWGLLTYVAVMGLAIGAFWYFGRRQNCPTGRAVSTPTPTI